MNPEDSVKIEFPCLYPIKVMGEDVEDFREEILLIIKKHAPDLCEEHITYRASRNRKYLAVNVSIMATGVPQLEALFEELKTSGRVALVL
ncbi:MAG: DUF493 domain-containing protein [Pseudomonadales bacterium]|nr:DUF493 domain-containing protein [Pseudomonadales bacterium]